MKLYVFCKNCQKESKVKPCYTSRFEMPSQVIVQCKQCNYTHDYSPNEVYAKSSLDTFILLICIVLAVILFVCLYSIGFMATLTVVVPALLYAVYRYEESKKIRLFNSVKK